MGQLKVEKNVGGIEGLCVITPTVHGDERGYFIETFTIGCQRCYYRFINVIAS